MNSPKIQLLLTRSTKILNDQNFPIWIDSFLSLLMHIASGISSAVEQLTHDLKTEGSIDAGTEKKMTASVRAFSIMTFSLTAFSIMTVSI